MTTGKAQQFKLDVRRHRALQLKTRARSYAAVMKQVNEEIAAGELACDPYNEEGHCYQDIQVALTVAKERREKSAETYFEMELEKLDALELAAWTVLEAKHYVVNQGMVVYMGNDPERKGNPYSGAKALAEHLREFPLEDDGPVLQAIDRILKVGDQRAKLLGLYAPVKKALEVSSGPGTNEAIDRFVALLAGGGQAQAAAPAATGVGSANIPDTRTAGQLLGLPERSDTGA